jgi:hypothetical protein
VWKKTQPVQPAKPVRMPTFHEYASAWLKGKTEGSIGDRPIDANTTVDYRWRLTKHLLPFFARYPLDEIDAALCQDFKSAKLREAPRSGRPFKPALSSATTEIGASARSGPPRSRY